MTVLEELQLFVKHITYWIISFLGFATFFFIFGLQKVVIFGKTLFLPMPGEHSFAVYAFNMMRDNLLPEGVELITTNPMSAFVSQVLVAMLLSFLLTTPLFIYKIITYLSPALFAHERKAVLLSVPPLVLLFISGSAFSYFFLIPATFKILYPYAVVIGAHAFFSIDEFIYYVCGLMIAAGVMFLLPMFMILLSFTGLIDNDFWKRNWQYACLLFLISSAIITPDGTGVTMIMLFIPLLTLYLIGCFVVKRFDDNLATQKVEELEKN